MDNSRRSFIRISALGASGIAIGTSGLGLYPLHSQDVNPVKGGTGKLKRTATYCEVCFWKCAAWAYTDEKGDVVKLIGNEIDPHCYG